MRLSETIDEPSTTTDVIESSINLNSLYCSHLWTNTNLRNTILTAPNKNSITYCYTCKGKIRKYELQQTRRNFTPHNHSTPNKQLTIEIVETHVNETRGCLVNENTSKAFCSLNRSGPVNSNDTNVESKQHIPSISQEIDSNITHKFRSYEMDTIDNNNRGRRKLSKRLRGIGCLVNFASTESPVKKRTQIKACSISVMILAIVIISFILVNYNNPMFNGETNVSTKVVPTKKSDSNETASAITNIYLDVPDIIKVDSFTEDYLTTTELPITVSTENNSLISNVIQKIRKNIRTYPKSAVKLEESEKPKDINNRDLSQRFCSCQNTEICMLDENSGTSICRESTDVDDPTGCGGLCALDTEACHLVDKARGVRVCRLLTLVTCSPDEWRCRNGLCVPAEARCDGFIQCYDRSDEMYCECDLTKHFRCGDAISCFPQTKLCDGAIDCWDGLDEVNCTTECPNDQFTCNDGQCILASRFCDGLVDCADGSDEPDGCGGNCGEHELQCRNQRCVPRLVRCDGHDNCGDASDEIQC